MKKPTFLIISLIALSLFSCAPQHQDELSSEPSPLVEPIDAQTETPRDANNIQTNTDALAEFNYVDPQRIVPTIPLKNALTYFKAKSSAIKNKNYVTVIDMTQHSSKKRMYVIDMRTGAVATYTTSHGKGSDTNNDGYAERFSNTPGSNMTSLGFYITGVTYQGSNGLSLRMHGQESTNSNAYSRAIVMHGADYVTATRAGRSWGCPAIERRYVNTLIPALKGGTLMYIYKK